MIKAAEFRAKCFSIIDQVERTGKAVVITKNGRPIAELVPHRSPRKNARGLFKHRLFVVGDIISPIDADWDALK
jgi:prevent-host-death family protein